MTQQTDQQDLQTVYQGVTNTSETVQDRTLIKLLNQAGIDVVGRQLRTTQHVSARSSAGQITVEPDSRLDQARLEKGAPGSEKLSLSVNAGNIEIELHGPYAHMSFYEARECKEEYERVRRSQGLIEHWPAMEQLSRQACDPEFASWTEQLRLQRVDQNTRFIQLSSAQLRELKLRGFSETHPAARRLMGERQEAEQLIGRLNGLMPVATEPGTAPLSSEQQRTHDLMKSQIEAYGKEPSAAEAQELYGRWVRQVVAQGLRELGWNIRAGQIEAREALLDGSETRPALRWSVDPFQPGGMLTLEFVEPGFLEAPHQGNGGWYSSANPGELVDTPPTSRLKIWSSRSTESQRRREPASHTGGRVDSEIVFTPGERHWPAGNALGRGEMVWQRQIIQASPTLSAHQRMIAAEDIRKGLWAWLVQQRVIWICPACGKDNGEDTQQELRGRLIDPGKASIAPIGRNGDLRARRTAVRQGEHLVCECGCYSYFSFCGSCNDTSVPDEPRSSYRRKVMLAKLFSSEQQMIRSTVKKSPNSEPMSSWAFEAWTRMQVLAIPDGTQPDSFNFNPPCPQCGNKAEAGRRR